MKVSILFKEYTNYTVYKILLFNIKTGNEYFSSTMYGIVHIVITTLELFEMFPLLFLH